MNLRRHKLAQQIALQAAAMVPGGGKSDIADLRVFPVQEPVSRRSYTIVRIRTRGGVTGWGECERVSSADIEKARSIVVGRPATAYNVISTGTPLDAAINVALLDITAKSCNAPVYRLLGGPTRFKVRALATLTGGSDAELVTALSAGIKAGFRAFQVPVPSTTSRNQGQAFDKAIRARMETLRSSAPTAVDFVLGGKGALTPADAGSVAASLERFHLLWFDEPCQITNVRTLRKIADETVTPLGFGSAIREASVYQDLLREGVVDILRPSIPQNGISRIRQIAILAETYYTAVAPTHEGGPIASASALHLAASLPNFFIQHIPYPSAEQDRQMRRELVSAPVELVRDGFAALPGGSGLGIEVSESALEKYKEAA